MKALIDGDIIVYRCAFAAEHMDYTLVDEDSGVPIAQFESAAAYKQFVKETELEGFTVERERRIEPLSHALANVNSVMRGILDSLQTTRYEVFLSKGKCFRHDLATIKEYKGNRKDQERPVYYEEVRDFLCQRYGALVYESIEADDALAMCQKEDTCIVSIDKDLLQVPGKHYNWVTGTKALITPEVGLKKLYMQVLTGDGTDNIPGIRGIGIKTARKLMADVPVDEAHMFDLCVDEWEKYLLKEMDGFEIYEDQDGLYFAYKHWNPDEKDHELATSREIATETLNLVKVGGSNARTAIESAGEDLPHS